MQITVHKIDSSRIQIQAVHEITPSQSGARQRGFELSAYFFVPRELAHGGSDELGGTHALVQPVVFPQIHRKNYYEIFAMNLAAILDTNNELSPLHRLEQMAGQVILPAERVLYELQMLVCVTKKACTNARKAQIERIHSRSNKHFNRPKGSQVDQTKNACDQLLREVEAEFYQISKAYLKIQDQLEKLGERYQQEVLHNINEAYRWTLEDLNHQILDWMLRVLKLSKHYQFSNEFCQFIQTELELQWHYQKHHGFATLGSNESKNESYLFHQRELKAWRYGGLLMSCMGSRSQSVLTHIWLSIASAIAMIFALGITLLSMYYYGQWSMPFLIFAVLGYMFKDRIKELLRNLFSNKFGNYNLLHLYDPRSKTRCGRIRESLDVCELLPPEVSTLRNLHKNPLSRIYKREIVIAYHESLKLNSRQLFKSHRRLQSGCQLLEFNLLPYLQNIKDSEAKQLWHPIESRQSQDTTEEIEDYLAHNYQKIKIERSYHLTVIIKAVTIDGQEISERYRIVLRGAKIAWIHQIV